MIKRERPPNFDRIVEVFPFAIRPGVIFAYGEDIYNPTGIEIPPALEQHEAVHQLRQRVLTDGPEEWWELYLTNPAFRYHEELLAHATEYRAQLRRLDDRNRRAALLTSTARRLVAPLYNYQPPRTMQQALKDLKKEIGL
jgi:hypothetical protein